METSHHLKWDWDCWHNTDLDWRDQWWNGNKDEGGQCIPLTFSNANLLAIGLFGTVGRKKGVINRVEDRLKPTEL
jgi:hypothetical protein